MAKARRRWKLPRLRRKRKRKPKNPGVAVNIDFTDFDQALQQLIKDAQTKPTRATKREIGTKAVGEMKDMTLKGLSPLKGKGGRFKRYKGKYREEIERNGRVRVGKRKWPKKLTPVNLRLTGEFMKSLVYWPIKYGVKIGFNEDLSEKKEQGHRDGANGQEKRPIIPIDGESFHQRIRKIFIEAFKRDLVRKLNK